jgi:hypothetical protein
MLGRFGSLLQSSYLLSTLVPGSCGPGVHGDASLSPRFPTNLCLPAHAQSLATYSLTMCDCGDVCHAVDKLRQERLQQ